MGDSNLNKAFHFPPTRRLQTVKLQRMLVARRVQPEGGRRWGWGLGGGVHVFFFRLFHRFCWFQLGICVLICVVCGLSLVSGHL